jgi:2-haloacid dehalogenase
MPSELFVFDAYGTLFDVHSAVARQRAAIGPNADRISDLWRKKQLEYTWTRTMMGAYRDFRQLTAEALDFAAATFGGIDGETRTHLLAAYETLAAYADVKACLDALRARSVRLAILSNGTPDMLNAALAAAKLDGQFHAVISVDELAMFKTMPAVYDLVIERFGVRPEDVCFLSSNRWDIAGAKKFGFRPIWVNRSNQPDEYTDLKPIRTVRSLADVPGLDV